MLVRPNRAETSSLQQTETIDKNRLINVSVLHLFISASNINGNKRVCFPNEREAIKYFRHTSLKIQSRERACILNGRHSAEAHRGSGCCRRSRCSCTALSLSIRILSGKHSSRPRVCDVKKELAGLRSLEKLQPVEAAFNWGRATVSTSVYMSTAGSRQGNH